MNIIMKVPKLTSKQAMSKKPVRPNQNRENWDFIMLIVSCGMRSWSTGGRCSAVQWDGNMILNLGIPVSLRLAERAGDLLGGGPQVFLGHGVEHRRVAG